MRPTLTNILLSTIAVVSMAAAPWAEAAVPAGPAAAPGLLMVNGDLSQPDPANPQKPLGWDLPDGLGVQWLPSPDGPGKAIRMDTRVSEIAMDAQWDKVGIVVYRITNPAPNTIAETYGLSFYCQPMAVIPGQMYRITVHCQCNGGAKIWVRGFGERAGEQRRLYETFKDVPGTGKGWKDVTYDFNPTKHTPAVTSMRVMLYAFYPAGVYWFSNIRLVPVGTPAPATTR